MNKSAYSEDQQRLLQKYLPAVFNYIGSIYVLFGVMNWFVLADAASLWMPVMNVLSGLTFLGFSLLLKRRPDISLKSLDFFPLAMALISIGNIALQIALTREIKHSMNLYFLFIGVCFIVFSYRSIYSILLSVWITFLTSGIYLGWTEQTTHFAAGLVSASAIGLISYFVRARSLHALENMTREELTLRNEADRLEGLITIAGQVAHEFNSPLTTLFLLADTLEQSKPKEAHGIRQVVRKLSETTEHLRLFAERSEPSRNTSSLEEKPFVSLLQTLLHQATTEIPELKSYLLQSNSVSPEVMCLLEENHLKRALLEIFYHAINSLRESSDPKIFFDSRITENGFEIRVSNNGPRIPNRFSRRIFEPFFSESFQKIQKKDKKGLGLSVAAALLKKQAGSVYFDTQAVLTTFVIVLPSRQNFPVISAS